MAPSVQEFSGLKMIREKAIMVIHDNVDVWSHQQEEFIPIKLLLSLLSILFITFETGPFETDQVHNQFTTFNAEIDAGLAGTSSGFDARPSKADDTSKLSLSSLNRELIFEDVLFNLSRADLHFLCSLPTPEGLLDNANVLVAGSIQNLTKATMNELHVFREVEKVLYTDGAAVLKVS